MKLHTRTTLLVSAVLIAVFAVMAYFTDLAITSLSERQEQEQAQLVATRISDSLEHHIKYEQRTARAPGQNGLVLDWMKVRDELAETLRENKEGISRVRVFTGVGDSQLEEMFHLPEEAGPPSQRELHDASERLDIAKVTGTSESEQTRFISAVAPVITSIDNPGITQVGSVSVLLAFDQRSSQATALRSLMWPLMALAIISITLMTYYLFRHIVYRPIDNLLLAMSKAEAGDLGAEVEATAQDEIGMLTGQFNRMLARIREMTGQLSQEQRRLEERVHMATAEIAERKEMLEDANLRLFEMQRQLTQLERFAAAGQLAAQFAHEVGTPLNLISGHVQLLRARATDERTTRRLDIISSQIERITGIVRAQLDSTRKPSPHFSPTDISSLLAHILEAAQPTLVARNIQLETAMARQLPLIQADADQLQQVFINLINNSLDAMPEGGVLKVAARLEGDFILTEIADTGAGIAAEHMDLIFDPLFTTKRSLGTGLGLPIVKQIISEHGGGIKVQSDPGHGTSFRITLPARAESHVTVEAVGGGRSAAPDLRESS